jgi:hypothetical protein
MPDGNTFGNMSVGDGLSGDRFRPWCLGAAWGTSWAPREANERLGRAPHARREAPIEAARFALRLSSSCDGWVYVTGPPGRGEAFRCACGALNMNLKLRAKSPAVKRVRSFLHPICAARA